MVPTVGRHGSMKPGGLRTGPGLCQCMPFNSGRSDGKSSPRQPFANHVGLSVEPHANEVRHSWNRRWSNAFVSEPMRFGTR